MTEEAKAERIAKRLARAGLCSRREAEAWIAAGRVAVDGRTLTTPAVTVTASSVIEVDGKPIPAPEPSRLWRYHKPVGLVTTSRDPQGRPTVFDRLPADMPRTVTVGRLDLNSEGLLLLTNDGTLARQLELPATGWIRRYRVRVRGRIDPARLESLESGVEVDGQRYGPIRATLDRQLPNNAWITVALTEGKNREVRRVLEHLGWPVMRLIRISYGPFQLGQLKPGDVEEVKPRVLRDQLGGSSGDKSTGRAKAREQKPFKGQKGRPYAATTGDAAASHRTGHGTAGPEPGKPRRKPRPAGKGGKGADHRGKT